ncbi:hypothetical protein [Qipengyuania nanhaisediminis]|uniref:hypothetical protein n=1 Tax=Qipengyuania nanhaisediminis TaxID=604088 RepID=UPI0038B3A9F1
MDSFLLCLLLTFAIALGGKEQLIIAQFADALERSAPLLFTGAFTAVLSAAIMAYGGAYVAGLLPQRAAEMLIAFALGFSAIELAWKVSVKPMKEPTRSFVAIGAVLFVRQLMDAPRFVIFALAAAAHYPGFALIGGAAGGVGAAWLGWWLGLHKLQQLPVRAVRLALATCLFLAALLIGLNARYVFL